MSSDAFLNLDGLILRTQAAVEKKAKLTGLRDQIEKDLVSKRSEVESLSTESQVLTQVVELLRHLMDAMVEKQIKIVEKMGTQGLQSVFPDLDLRLESEVSPKYGKVAVDFYFRKGVEGSPGSYRGDPLASFGGGPCSVVSLILRILTIKKLGLTPILVLDESLAAVAEVYTGLTGQLIRTLSEQLGFDVLLVTHNPAFQEHAHRCYRCTEKVETEGFTYVEVT